MAENSGVEEPRTDLLGEPWRELKDPRGRKAKRWLPEVYEKVETLRGLGMGVEDIAIAMGCSAPTLRKYFLPQLESGEVRLRARLLERLAAKAADGNVAALKESIRLLDAGRAAAPIRKTARTAPLGKKAAADLDALTAHEGTAWGDLLPN